MHLKHLALEVREQERSIDFYSRYFGFDPGTAHRYPDGVVIIRDADGFALAFGRDLSAERTPGFPHFGFDAATPDDVRRLRSRLLTDGVELIADEDEETYVGFKCLDPDGHVVEVAWEAR